MRPKVPPANRAPLRSAIRPPNATSSTAPPPPMIRLLRKVLRLSSRIRCAASSWAVVGWRGATFSSLWLGNISRSDATSVSTVSISDTTFQSSQLPYTPIPSEVTTRNTSRDRTGLVLWSSTHNRVSRNPAISKPTATPSTRIAGHLPKAASRARLAFGPPDTPQAESMTTIPATIMPTPSRICSIVPSSPKCFCRKNFLAEEYTRLDAAQCRLRPASCSLISLGQRVLFSRRVLHPYGIKSTSRPAQPLDDRFAHDPVLVVLGQKRKLFGEVSDALAVGRL